MFESLCKDSIWSQKVDLKPKVHVFFRLLKSAWNLSQTLRLDESFRNPDSKLKKVLCAQSYGHFIAALELWSQCQIFLIFLSGALKSKCCYLRLTVSQNLLLGLSWPPALRLQIYFWGSQLGEPPRRGHKTDRPTRRPPKIKKWQEYQKTKIIKNKNIVYK